MVMYLAWLLLSMLWVGDSCAADDYSEWHAHRRKAQKRREEFRVANPAIAQAIEGDDDQRLQVLLNNNSVPQLGSLYVAIYDNKQRAAGVLIDHCRSLVLEKRAPFLEYNEEDRNSLMLAAEHGYSDMVVKLLELGADVNANIDETDTALTVAAAKQSVSVIQTLLDWKANPNIAGFLGCPLRIAISYGQCAAALLLIEGGADIHARYDIGGDTPLHVCCSYCEPQVGKNYPEDERFALEMRDDIRQAFGGAAPVPELPHNLNEMIGVIRLLLSKGAQTDVTNTFDQTPRDITTHPDIIALLEEYAEAQNIGSSNT